MVVEVVEVLEEVGGTVEVVLVITVAMTVMDPLAMNVFVPGAHGVVEAAPWGTVHAETASTDPAGSVPGTVNQPTRRPRAMAQSCEIWAPAASSHGKESSRSESSESSRSES
jgi:hypothetical protein